jgi:hypothetical protein
MFGSTVVNFGAAALVALLAVWLALEPLAHRAKLQPLRLLGNAAKGCLVVALKPLTFDPVLVAYSLASGQGREGISKRTIRGSSKRSRYFRGVRRLLKEVGFSAALSALFRPSTAFMFAFPIRGGSPEADLLDEAGLTEGEKKELEELGGKADELRSKLMERLGEMVSKGADGADKEEVERREKELGEKVDKLIPLLQKAESTELQDFKAELGERLKHFEEQMQKFGRQPIGSARGGSPLVSKEDAYTGDNIFLDKLQAAK